MAQRLTDIGLGLGGAAGVRLSQRLGFSVSRNTLLSLVRKIPLPSVGSLSTVGVDDFCFRKGQTYGTIVVDLERSRPVVLLNDRSAETLAEWLKVYPDIKIVSRDRAKAYEKGIRQGVQSAIQVADRFHLLQNLAETLYQVFGMHGKAIKVVEETHNQNEAIRPDSTALVPVQPPIPTTQQQDLASTRRKMSISNGPVEGHIKRLKMLKRQMYGRAKIDLLECRFLLAT
jgi:transposase